MVREALVDSDPGCIVGDDQESGSSRLVSTGNIPDGVPESRKTLVVERSAARNGVQKDRILDEGDCLLDDLAVLVVDQVGPIHEWIRLRRKALLQDPFGLLEEPRNDLVDELPSLRRSQSILEVCPEEIVEDEPISADTVEKSLLLETYQDADPTRRAKQDALPRNRELVKRSDL